MRRQSVGGERRDRHVCWISDSPDTPSGFGNVTRAVCTRLASRGYRVSILGWQTREQGRFDGCDVFPVGRDALGADALYSFLVRHRPSVVVSLADVWWLPYMSSPHVRRQMELIDAAWALYFPIDGTRPDGSLPPSWVELLREVDYPIAMTRFGQQAACAAGIAADYIPHGVDTAVFSPPPNRAEHKAELGLGGRFVVLSDSRNQPRKMVHRLLEIFARVVETHPDAMLHLHTDPDDEFSHSAIYSYDVRGDIEHLGLSGHVRFTPGFVMKRGAGLTPQELASYYRAADVHVLASSGEGFGLPTLQAAAAGVVPVAVAYSANPELLADHGCAIPAEDWIDNEFGIRRALIDVDAAADAIRRLCDDPVRLAARSAGAREFALAYDWDAIADRWAELLDGMCGSPAGRRRVTPPEDQFVRLVQRGDNGSSVAVTMIRREAGRLEASIMADARMADDVLSCPTAPPAVELQRVRVPRERGLLCVAPPDLDAFTRLRSIFPVLHCFVPMASGADQPPMPAELADAIDLVVYTSPAELLYRLARSVLLLDSSGCLPRELHEDAALFGVPAVLGASPVVPLRPPSRAGSAAEVVAAARALLTNPVRLNAVSRECGAAARRLTAPDETALVQALREQHRQERNVAVLVGA